MKTAKIDMSYKDNSPSCCGFYDSKYPIGFFLNSQQVKDLGLDNVSPEQTVEIAATLRVTSVTKRTTENDDGETKTECYVCVTEMGVEQAAKSAKESLSEAYESK